MLYETTRQRRMNHRGRHCQGGATSPVRQKFDRATNAELSDDDLGDEDAFPRNVGLDRMRSNANWTARKT